MKNRKYETLQDVKKPTGEIFVVYFSSTSENTRRFVEKLGVENLRIPINDNEEVFTNKDYVIICPTFAGGGELWQGAVPKQVINFLNVKNNRNRCKGVIATGNTNFGETFALAGPIISQKLKIPLLYQLELLGTKNDVMVIQKILREFWNKENYEK